MVRAAKDLPTIDIGVFGARSIPSTYSGYETFLTVLLPELARRGHRVTMYCRRDHLSDSGPYKRVRRIALPAIETKQLSTLSHGLVSSLASRLNRHDVVLVVNVANAAFCLANRATGQRVVLNTDGQEWLRGKWGSLGRRVFYWSARMADISTSALVADSVAMRAVYRDLFSADSTVIPYCWTDLPRSDDESALDRYGVEPHRYVLIAGRMVPENHADRVAQAYVNSGLDWPLLILGEANYSSPVAQRIAELAQQHTGLRLVGHVENRAAYAALVGGAAAYLHAHSVGGINPSLIEAMGSGALTVAFDTPFNREALGDSGILFSDFDDSLVAILRDVPKLGERHGLLRKRARDRAKSVFSLRRIADAYEQLLLAVSYVSPWQTTVMPSPWSEQ